VGCSCCFLVSASLHSFLPSSSENCPLATSNYSLQVSEWIPFHSSNYLLETYIYIYIYIYIYLLK
jgi:hypothetical protein